MAPTELLNAIRVRPFEPFRLWLSDGTSHEVRHPEMLLVGVRTSFLGVPDPENPELAGYTIRLDNLHITKLEPLAAVR